MKNHSFIELGEGLMSGEISKEYISGLFLLMSNGVLGWRIAEAILMTRDVKVTKNERGLCLEYDHPGHGKAYNENAIKSLMYDFPKFFSYRITNRDIVMFNGGNE